MMNPILYKLIIGKIAKIAQLLAVEESRNTYINSFPISNVQEFIIKKRRFYIFQSNIFKLLVTEGGYYVAKKKFPQLFGTKDANDILKALKIYLNLDFMSDDRFSEFLKHEKMAYIVEVVDDKVLDKILRIDLYRLINIKNGHKEFTGGLFHVLKHFALDEQSSLSINKKGYIIPYWDYVVNKIIYNFYFCKIEQIDDNNYMSSSRLDDNHKLECYYYHNKEVNLFFIKTLFVCNNK